MLSWHDWIGLSERRGNKQNEASEADEASIDMV